MKHKTQFAITLLATVISTELSAFAPDNIDTTAEPTEHIEVMHQKQPYRGDVALKDTPQAVSIVEGDFLLAAGIVDFQSALDFSSSIVRQNNFGGMWDGFAIRGFAGDENLPSGYLINGFSAGRGYSGRRNTTNIHSIEILKGPGSALYGRSEPGGTVNIITKKPQFFEDGYIQASIGNYNKRRIEGDYTNKITDDVAFRVNGSFEDAESYRDTVETEHTTINASLLWGLSKRTNLSYELEYLDQAVPFDRGIPNIEGLDYVPPSRFLGEPNDKPMDIKATGHQFVLQHKLNDTWDLLAGLGYRESSFEGFSSEIELSPGRQILYTDKETVSRNRRFRDYDATDLSIRLELSGTLNIGNYAHHILAGVDAYDYQLDTFQKRWRVAWGAGDTTYSINLHNPVYGQNAPETSPTSDNIEKQKSYGAYIQDQIDVSQNWKIQLGLRVDKFDQEVIKQLNNTETKQDQTATSPRIGLVYQVNDSVTLYSSYAEGFRPNSGVNAKGDAFAPEESKSYEVGVKWDSTDGIFDGSIAIYKAQKSNILSADPVNAGFSAALGEAESKGVELDVTSNIGDNTTLAFSYAYTDAYTTNDITNADWGVDIKAGSPLINIAKNTANLTLRHYLTLGNNDADIGVSINYVGDRSGETINPSYELPAYTTVRLFSSAQLADNLKVMFDVENLLDKEYFASSYSELWTMPGAPRTYRASVQYQF